MRRNASQNGKPRAKHKTRTHVSAAWGCSACGATSSLRSAITRSTWTLRCSVEQRGNDLAAAVTSGRSTNDTTHVRKRGGTGEAKGETGEVAREATTRRNTPRMNGQTNTGRNNKDTQDRETDKHCRRGANNDSSVKDTLVPRGSTTTRGDNDTNEPTTVQM